MNHVMSDVNLKCAKPSTDLFFATLVHRSMFLTDLMQFQDVLKKNQSNKFMTFKTEGFPQITKFIKGVWELRLQCKIHKK